MASGAKPTALTLKLREMGLEPKSKEYHAAYMRERLKDPVVREKERERLMLSARRTRAKKKAKEQVRLKRKHRKVKPVDYSLLPVGKANQPWG